MERHGDNSWRHDIDHVLEVVQRFFSAKKATATNGGGGKEYCLAIRRTCVGRCFDYGIMNGWGRMGGSMMISRVGEDVVVGLWFGWKMRIDPSDLGMRNGLHLRPKRSKTPVLSPPILFPSDIQLST